MANVTVHALLGLNTGEIVDLSTASLAEGSESELQVSSLYAVSSVSLGQFADGKTITQIILPPTAVNGMAYAYIDRRGSIAACLPVGVDGQRFSPVGGFNFRLQAGDTVRVFPKTAASRTFAYNVITNTGVNAIFTGTAASGNVDLTHIKSGQGVGTSLVGQSIVQHYATSTDGSKLSTGGIVILNDKGLPVGGCTATDPGAQQVMPNSIGGSSIGLNFVGRVTCNA